MSSRKSASSSHLCLCPRYPFLAPFPYWLPSVAVESPNFTRLDGCLRRRSPPVAGSVSRKSTGVTPLVYLRFMPAAADGAASCSRAASAPGAASLPWPSLSIVSTVPLRAFIIKIYLSLLSARSLSTAATISFGGARRSVMCASSLS